MTKEEAHQKVIQAKKDLLEFINSRVYDSAKEKELNKALAKAKKVWMKLVTAEMKAEQK